MVWHSLNHFLPPFYIMSSVEENGLVNGLYHFVPSLVEPDVINDNKCNRDAYANRSAKRCIVAAQSNCEVS